ncbi:MAG: hypothetical protein ACJ76P_05650 [Actinomycetota bacterium]|jgi:hypothetical protein
MTSTPDRPKHEWHVVELDNRFGHGISGRVEIRRQGRALFVRRDEASLPARIMDLGGNPPLICGSCGEQI